MTYAFYYDVPGNEHIYQSVARSIGDAAPDGLITAIVAKTESGLRHINVWESREHWTTFRDQRAQPAIAAALAGLGIPAPAAPPEEHELDLVDVVR